MKHFSRTSRSAIWWATSLAERVCMPEAARANGRDCRVGKLVRRNPASYRFPLDSFDELH